QCRQNERVRKGMSSFTYPRDLLLPKNQVAQDMPSPSATGIGRIRDLSRGAYGIGGQCKGFFWRLQNVGYFLLMSSGLMHTTPTSSLHGELAPSVTVGSSHSWLTKWT